MFSYWIERRAANGYIQNAAIHGGPAGGDTSYDVSPLSIYRRIVIKTILTCAMTQSNRSRLSRTPNATYTMATCSQSAAALKFTENRGHTYTTGISRESLASLDTVHQSALWVKGVLQLKTKYGNAGSASKNCFYVSFISLSWLPAFYHKFPLCNDVCGIVEGYNRM